MPIAARKVSLTDKSLRALKPAPAGKRVTVWDALMPGLAVRVTDKGKRSFYAVKRRAGWVQPTWALLGAYPVTTLAEARAKAREVLGALAAGDDPATLAAAKREAQAEAERRRRESTFRAVAEEFIRRHVVGLRAARMTEGIVRRELIPAWGERPIAEISRRDVIKLVEAILDRGGEKPAPGTRRKAGGPYAARHALAVARKLFNWAAGRDLLAVSPCDRIKAAELHGAPEARDRVLSDHEIREVWKAAEATPYPYGALVKLLMLTGQRRDEIAGAKWSEIDLSAGLLTIGAGRMKAKTGHIVPLTPAAIEILKALPRFATGDYVFSGQTGDKPFSGFSKAKKRLDEEIAKASGAVAPYSLHDLRRTVRTRLAELGVTPFVGELVIGHTQKGVHAVYDLHRYDAEKRAALEQWEAKLLAILAPEPEPEATSPAPDNVVSMPARVRA
jgi:integrase